MTESERRHGAEIAAPMAGEIHAASQRRDSPGGIALTEYLRMWLASSAPDVPVIIVPIKDRLDTLLVTVEQLLATRPPGTPLILVDTPPGDPQGGVTVMGLAANEQALYYLPTDAFGGGEVTVMNEVIQWCAPRDVVVVASDTTMPANWLTRLRTAATSRTNIATATPFANDGAFLSIPYRNLPTTFLPRGMNLAQADTRIAETARGIYPTIPTPVPHCVYYRRDGLDVAGPFDASLTYHAAAIDYAQRALTAGFCHVLADTLFVFSHGGRLATQPTADAAQVLATAMLAARYPWYASWRVEAERAQRTPLASAVERARVALLGYRVAIDARSLSSPTMGTQKVTLELIRALARQRDVGMHLTLILDDRMSLRALDGVDVQVDAIVRTSELTKLPTPSFEVVHRPYQIPTLDDLHFLRGLAGRLIFTHLDSILFANPGYVTDNASWINVRHAMHSAFATADGIMFLSEDAAADARQHGLVAPAERTIVAYSGVDHQLLTSEARRPRAFPAIGTDPYLLMIGTNYKHKNRPLAMRIQKILERLYGWGGHLVFAGVGVPAGTSDGQEAVERLQDSSLHLHVHEIGAVNEEEKRWLYEHAAVVLYPSVIEGFGLVPFEATAVGTPAIAARTTSVREVLGDEVKYLDSFDAERNAAAVWALLTDAESASRQIRAINARAERFTWDGVARRTNAFYARILDLPPRTPSVDFGGDLLTGYRAAEGIARFREEIVAAREFTEAVRQDAHTVWEIAEHRTRDLAEVQGYARKLEADVAEVQGYARKLEADVAEVQGYARKLEADVAEIRQGAAGTKVGQSARTTHGTR